MTRTVREAATAWGLTPEAEIARLTRRNKKLEQAVAALVALKTKVLLCEQSEEMQAVYQSARIHGVPYTGANYEAELAAADDAILSIAELEGGA